MLKEILSGSAEMSDESKQWIDAIVKLTALTQERKLTWSSRDQAPKSIGPTFLANYKGRTLRLYRISVVELRTLEYEERERAVLEFIDAPGNALWSFPHHQAVDDLYEAAKYQVAGVQEFLGDLLTE